MCSLLQLQFVMQFLGGIAVLRRCGLLLQMEQCGLSVTLVSPAKMAEPIDMSFGLWTWVGPRRHVFDGGAHWRHLADTIESSMCSGDAALCQITWTTCQKMQQQLHGTNVCYYFYISRESQMMQNVQWSRPSVCLSVCLSVCPSPHSHTTAQTRM